MSGSYLPYQPSSNQRIPLAYPQPAPAPPPRPAASASSSAWQRPGSFYLGGSAAPYAVFRRHGQTSQYESPRYSPPPPLARFNPGASSRDVERGGGPSTSEGRCCCCGAKLRFRRGEESFRCSVCDTVTEVEVTGGPRETPSTLHIISAMDVEDLSRQLRRGSLPIEESFASRVAAVFSDLQALEASFRYRSDLPSLEILEAFFELVMERPDALQALREAVVSMLLRPRLAGWVEGSDGACWITLLESPLLLPSTTPDPLERTWITSQLLGLISNLPNKLHHSLVRYLSSTQYPAERFKIKVETVTALISRRIGNGIAAAERYEDDWGVKAGTRVVALLFQVNELNRRVPLETFYCSIIDSLGEEDLDQSFDSWGRRPELFSFCQYPFLLSLGVKIHLLSYEADKQMVAMALQAQRTATAGGVMQSPFVTLKIRRERLVGDSLQEISDNRAFLKKKLRIQFVDEAGIDAGGLRKEFLLLLSRRMFDPQYGFFVVDEDSKLCWFNPTSLETGDEYYLQGAVVGLAIYNHVNLDLPLPLALYKQLRSEPTTLLDLWEFRPGLAKGLQQLLDYESDDVEDVFCRTFVGDYEFWGEPLEVPLVPGGEDIAVTNGNRKAYVDLYVQFVLVTSVKAQFDSFKRGFDDVTSGDALQLFGGEELELLVRGSREPLDIVQLKSMTTYEGFDGEEDWSIQLFWRVFESFDPDQQRKFLSFTTGSDRIPPTGGLQLKITCLGSENLNRYPESHTCFNQLCLARFNSFDLMKGKLLTAMYESEGFSLK